MTEPRRGRPVMPEGYGLDQATTYVPWDQVTERLRDSINYWLSSTRPDGRPHVVPRWGVWLHDRFWYDGSPETVHAQNLEESPECVLHLESGSEVVIVEGRSSMSEPIEAEGLGRELADEYARKYSPEYTPAADQWSDDIAGGMRRLAPRRVLTWTDFPRDVTRYTF